MNIRTDLLYFCIGLLICTTFKSYGNNFEALDDSVNFQTTTDSMFSSSLNTYRKLSIYFPPDFKKGKDYPVVYCTDGQVVIDEYKGGIDSLIKEGEIPSVIMVGVFSNEDRVPGKEFEYRNYEYIKGWATERDSDIDHLFNNHLNFFSVEVPEYLNSKYGIAANCTNTLFYGFSNGAGFGISMSMLIPEFAETYICFSMGGGYYQKGIIQADKSCNPFYYIGYGSKEPPPLITASYDFEAYLDQSRIEYKAFVFDGGHEREKWKQEFFRILPMVLQP